MALRTAEKRQAILTAARVLFFASGVEGVSVERIAANAGVSKVTLYKHFGDKFGILEAVVADITTRFQAGLDEVALGTRPLERALALFAEQLLTAMFAAGVVEIEEVLSIEANNNPQLAKSFFAAGSGRTRNALAKALASRSEQGELVISDPQLAADQFLGLAFGMFISEVRFRVRPPPSADDVRQQAEAAAAAFLRAYGPLRNAGPVQPDL